MIVTLNMIYQLLQTIHANQLNMIGMLNRLVTEESKMAFDLTTLTNEVANNSTVTGSVVSLLQQLSNEIANIPPSSDPTTQAALNALVATLSQNDQAIAHAVVVNTPAAPTPTPAPAPTPAPTGP